jgi:GDP-L-fucose synthase
MEGGRSPMASKFFALEGKRVYVAGHRGMVGGAIVRRLAGVNCEIVTAERAEVDLLDQRQTRRWLDRIKPDVVIVAAAKVGGIHANNAYPADFIHDNLGIALNVVHAAFESAVAKLLFLGSSCTYPKLARQPITEEELLAGPLEPTNQWYAVAKIAGLMLCQAYRRQYGADYISLMPANVFGPGDNYHPENSHVVAALIRRFHEAKLAGAPSATVWGTGTARREFLFVDDLADAVVFALENYSAEPHLNVGTGQELAISEFSRLVARVVGFEGRLEFDASRPDGTPRKLLDVTKLAKLGWTARTSLEEGLRRTYAAFLAGNSRTR